jgi:hypothetical protein
VTPARNWSPPPPEAGRLYLMPGSASGPTGSGSTMLTARTLGVSALRGTLTDQG